jgi:hypothetical protein
MKSSLLLASCAIGFAVACSSSENTVTERGHDGGGGSSGAAGAVSGGGAQATGGASVGGTSAGGARSTGGASDGGHSTGGTSTGGAPVSDASTGSPTLDAASDASHDNGGCVDATDADCAKVWVRQFGGPNADGARSVAADDTGNVYVAGVIGGQDLGGPAIEGGSFDAYLRKLGPNGLTIWTRQFGSSGDDAADSVAVDGAGNVYVAGSVGGALPNQTALGFWDVFVRKYDASGNEIWTRQFGSKGYDTGRVTVDASGNVIVGGLTESGLSDQSDGGVDGGAVSYLFVRKFDSSGTELWTRQFGSTGEQVNGSANVLGTANVDGVGNVYFVGITDGTLPGQTNSGREDAFLRKYDPAGTELWTRQFGTSENDGGRAVSADRDGNVYVVGDTFGAFPNQTSAGKADAFVRKFDETGTEVWTRQFGTATPDGATTVQIDGAGVVYVGGTTSGTLPGRISMGSTDLFIRTYDGAGTELRTRQLGTADIDQDISLSLGPSALYVAGATRGAFRPSEGSLDAFVIALTR